MYILYIYETRSVIKTRFEKKKKNTSYRKIYYIYIYVCHFSLYFEFKRSYIINIIHIKRVRFWQEKKYLNKQ